LQYVRNHGAVPKIKWSSHRIFINGLVDQPYTITMDELVAMPHVTLPITLVCAGKQPVEWPTYVSSRDCNLLVRVCNDVLPTNTVFCAAPDSSASEALMRRS